MQTRGTFPELNDHRKKGRSVRGKSKVEKVMHEFKRGTLHSGSKKGPKVHSRKQAIAIALSEQREQEEHYDNEGSSKAGYAMRRQPSQHSKNNPKGLAARRDMARRLSNARRNR